LYTTTTTTTATIIIIRSYGNLNDQPHRRRHQQGDGVTITLMMTSIQQTLLIISIEESF